MKSTLGLGQSHIPHLCPPGSTLELLHGAMLYLEIGLKT